MTSPNTYLQSLAAAGWLAPAGVELAPRLLDAGRLVHRPAGAWIHAEGDPETGLLIVLEGAVDLFCHGLGQRQVQIGHLRAGGAIGQSLRLGGGPRLVTAVAATPSLVLAVPDAALFRLADQHPALWRAMSTLLYGQLRFALQAQADLLTLPPLQRIAARLADLARSAAPGEPIAIGQQALGEMTGLTRKTVNAALRRLQTSGLLRLGYKKIAILDPEGLLDLAAS